jgi:hypothetical protein
MVPMRTTHKQTVTFTKPEISYLRIEAKRLGISVAYLVRRIIDQHQEKQGKSQ